MISTHSWTHVGKLSGISRLMSRTGSSPTRWATLIALCATLLLAPHGPFSAAQDTVISPIKIHGGAMTFFSTLAWQPFKGSDQTFCVPLHPEDVHQLHVQGFQLMPASTRVPSPPTAAPSATPADGALQLTSAEWRMELRGHDQNERNRLQPLRDEGMVLSASTRDCNDRTSGTPSLRLTTLGSGRFYPPPDLLPSVTFKGNKRFRSTCDVNSADRCERIAEIKVFDVYPQTPKYTLDCTDGSCAIFVGKLLSMQTHRPIPVDPGYPPPKR